MIRKHKGLSQAMNAIELTSDARLFMAGYINSVARQRPRRSAVDLVKFNMGYHLGYLSESKRHFWMGCTNLEHPFFGRKNPKPLEAFNAGVRMVELMDKNLDSYEAAAVIRSELEEGKLNRPIRKKLG